MTSALGSGADAVLAAALDRLIPDDEHGPGALAACVPAYVGGALEHAGDAAIARWREGLAAFDALARAREGGAFAALAPDTQDRVLELAAGGDAPEVARAFFEELRRHAIEGMFGDPAWGGNAGGAGWRLLGYPGPRHVWSADDQRIGERP